MAETNIKNLPEGSYFTEVGYSQMYPLKEVRRTAQTVTLVRVKAERDPDWKPEMHPGGFVAHCSNQLEQTWLYAGLEEYEITIYATKLGWSRKGVKFIENRATYFYDYNF